jgi:hypothetical protein
MDETSTSWTRLYLPLVLILAALILATTITLAIILNPEASCGHSTETMDVDCIGGPPGVAT